MPPIQWSSPTRRFGGRNLSPIPTEIYLAIFTYTRTIPFHKRLLRELSLVCRQFYAILIPWIFEDVEFSSNAGKGLSSSPDRASLSRRIRAGESTALTLAKHVKYCTFTQWNPKAQEQALEWLYSELLLLHTNAMRAMSNLKELEMSACTLTKAFFKAMPFLSHLESLKMMNCYISKDISPKHLEKLSSLKLKTLHFQIYPVFKGPDINALRVPGSFDAFFDHLNLKYLENVDSSSEHLVKCLLRVEGDLALTNACFHEVEDQKSLALLFHKTPSLRSFSTYSMDNYQPPLELGSDMLPDLTTLKVPASIFNILLGRRPVGEVEFSRTTPLNEFKGLGIVSKPFTSMRVPAQIYEGFPFWKHFPKLLDLEIYYRFKLTEGDNFRRSAMKELKTTLLKWPQQPVSVRSLMLEVASKESLLLDLVEQHLLISKILHPIFPKLRQCRLVSCISWFLVEEDAQWRPEIVDGFDQEVTRLMAYGEYFDFNGFLEDFITLAGF